MHVVCCRFNVDCGQAGVLHFAVMCMHKAWMGVVRRLYAACQWPRCGVRVRRIVGTGRRGRGQWRVRTMNQCLHWCTVRHAACTHPQLTGIYIVLCVDTSASCNPRSSLKLCQCLDIKTCPRQVDHHACRPSEVAPPAVAMVIQDCHGGHGIRTVGVWLGLARLRVRL